MIKKLITTTFLSLLCYHTAFAGMDEDVFQLKKTWEQLKYKTPLQEQEKGFEALLNQSQKITSQYPDKAEPLVWQGIIEGTFAGVRNGISGQLAALSLVKDAKIHFEQAIKIWGTLVSEVDPTTKFWAGSAWGVFPESKVVENIMKNISKTIEIKYGKPDLICASSVFTHLNNPGEFFEVADKILDEKSKLVLLFL